MFSKDIEKLYTSEKANMIAYVKSHMNNRTRDAEDLVQDVMLNMFRLLNMNTKIENLAAYAWRSLKNLIIDNWRRKEQNTDSIEDHEAVLVSDETGPEDNMLKEHFAQYLEQAIRRLKPSEQAIWIATEVEGISYQELSEAWSEPLGTLLSRKYRAEKKILNTLNTLYEEVQYEKQNT